MKRFVVAAIVVVVLIGGFFVWRQMFPVDLKDQIPCSLESSPACI
jgi:uncharacterized protein YneF (UPF0154 family)